MSKRRDPLLNEELINRLIQLPDHELSDVLRDVSAVRRPYPLVTGNGQPNHFVFGIAHRHLNWQYKGKES